MRDRHHLPPAFAARLNSHAPVLMSPPGPTSGVTATADRMRRGAVAAALTPWQQAIAAARAAALRAPDPSTQTARSKNPRIHPMNPGIPPATPSTQTARFENLRIHPMNPETPPTIPPTQPARFENPRIDPLDREPAAFPDPDPQPAHRVHEPAHLRESTRRAADAQPAPQARKSLPQMNADDR
jgi:hypothetical protein